MVYLDASLTQHVAEHASSDSHDAVVLTNSNAELDGVEVRIPLTSAGNENRAIGRLPALELLGCFAVGFLEGGFLWAIKFQHGDRLDL